jgi:glycyl-tRNA synthetase alpha subunit
MTFQDVMEKVENLLELKRDAFSGILFKCGGWGRDIKSCNFFGILGDKEWNVVYFEPSARPATGGMGDIPVRLYPSSQAVVIMKTAAS